MAALSLFKNLFGSGSAAAGQSVRGFVIDGASLAGPSVEKDPSPRDQLDLLRKVGRFAQQENLTATVVFNSEPLRKVGDGEEFEGAKVHFTDSTETYPKDFQRIAGKLGAGTVVVTAGGEIEKLAASSGFTVLRGSTLLKAIDGTSPRSSNRRRNGPSGRSNNRRGRSRDGGNGESGGGNSSRRRPESKPRPDRNEPRGVEDLIDVVD